MGALPPALKLSSTPRLSPMLKLRQTGLGQGDVIGRFAPLGRSGEKKSIRTLKCMVVIVCLGM